MPPWAAVPAPWHLAQLFSRTPLTRGTRSTQAPGTVPWLPSSPPVLVSPVSPPVVPLAPSVPAVLLSLSACRTTGEHAPRDRLTRAAAER
jgi:hypothetical protein